jgi:hypothetical protein
MALGAAPVDEAFRRLSDEEAIQWRDETKLGSIFCRD